MNFKSGYVAILGLPNAGKSTLMNAVIGEKLSIITSKPQTTRKRITGIYSDEKAQIIFLDTPGILEPNYLLQEKMMEFVDSSIKDADLILLLLDISYDKKGNKLFSNKTVDAILGNKRKKKVLIINKIDLSNQDELKNIIEHFEKLKMFESIIPISAAKNFNVETLKEKIIELLPEGPKYYPEDQLSDENERFFVTEIIRERIFEIFKDEVPYSTEVIIDEFKERDGRKDFISASIIVERDSQKPIIIGHKGESIKKIGQLSRESIEAFLGREVYLELHVKVKAKWRSNITQLKNFGYHTGNE